MCIAVPGEITDKFSTEAKVKIMNVEMMVNTQLLEDVQIGDYVLVHAGCAIEKIDKAYFVDLNNIYNRFIDVDEVL